MKDKSMLRNLNELKMYVQRTINKQYHKMSLKQRHLDALYEAVDIIEDFGSNRGFTYCDEQLIDQ